MQTRNSDRGFLAAVVVAGFLAVGVPYWRMPYGDLEGAGSVLGLGLAVVGLGALLLCARRSTGFWNAVGWMTGSVVAAMAVRIALDVSKDATSHNLWPLEIGMGAGVGFGCALAGAVAGKLIGGRRTAGEESR